MNTPKPRGRIDRPAIRVGLIDDLIAMVLIILLMITEGGGIDLQLVFVLAKTIQRDGI